jgi:hypothetical protein
MLMSMVLELQFLNEANKTVTFSVDEPKETLTDNEVLIAMQQILASGAFTSTGGNLTAVKGARFVERTIREINA